MSSGTHEELDAARVYVYEYVRMQGERDRDRETEGQRETETERCAPTHAHTNHAFTKRWRLAGDRCERDAIGMEPMHA